MLKKKFMICIVVFLFLIVSGITYAEAVEKSGQITIWLWDPNMNYKAMQEAGERYAKDNPKVTFEITDLAKQDVEQKLHINLASGITTALPDIVLIEDYNAQKYLQSYPGAFADLTDKIRFSDFANYKVGLMTLDEKVYGVPWDSGASGLFYRTDYLEKAGYKSEDLNNITWDKFIEIGKKVKEKTGKAMIGLDLNNLSLVKIMMQSAGKWYFDDKGNVNLSNNDALKEALKTNKAIVNADIITRTDNWSDWAKAYSNGEFASVITGVWIISTMKADETSSGKWKVAPTPRLNITGAVNASNLGGSSWYVLESSKNKDLAIDFLSKTFAGDSDFYQKILADLGAVGTYLPAYSGAGYFEEDEFFSRQKVPQDFAKWIKLVPTVNYGVYTHEADQAIVVFMPDIYSGKISIEDALEKAEEQFKNQIKR